MVEFLNFNKIEQKIVTFGMSCAGKTTFANLLKDHKYHCFDALFQWHLIEAFGFSAEENLKNISLICNEEKYVLDGWSLADKSGKFLPKDSCVYVIYAPYDKIIDQYRIKVFNREDYKIMYKKWYWEIPYEKFPNTRYVSNEGQFVEKTRSDFEEFLNST